MRTPEICLLHLVAAVDELLRSQLQAVIDTTDYTELKATWTGLHWLVQQQQSGDGTKIKIMDLCQVELSNNLRSSGNLSQSLLYQRLYREGLCTLGGEPFGLLMAGYSFEFFNHIPSEQAGLVRQLSELGELSLCPIVLGMGNLWQSDNPSLSSCASRLERVGTFADYESFRAIREQVSASFLAVTWPRFTTGNGRGGYNPVYRPRIRSVWCHSGYALLALVIREYGEYGWFSGLQAWGEGVKCGAVLPEQQEKPGVMAEIRLTESVESTFTRLGIMPLGSGWLDHTAGFFSMSMTGVLPGKESCQFLPPLLIVCRFGHYLKVKTRERVGSSNQAVEYANDLQRWLDQYCSSSEIRELSLLAVSPLKWAKLSVQEEGTKPGAFLATLELLPHLPPGLTVDALRIHLQLSTEFNDFLPDHTAR
ncbi:type VI secretion system contractile sheath domain-containing protein [Endozoicomonas atrinae]|uniref:type VI secretion system contractile sheath domain-containing protein n=1 Tax=Endozoicomonas atrinae TaxID=1333660 RepID=UPI0008250D1B|nr:type VI secretion system contractile sheath large subunit [Endozoicomonas atrinae]